MHVCQALQDTVAIKPFDASKAHRVDHHSAKLLLDYEAILHDTFGVPGTVDQLIAIDLQIQHLKGWRIGHAKLGNREKLKGLMNNQDLLC